MDEDEEEHQRQVLAAFDEHQSKLEDMQKAHSEEIEALERLQLVSARFRLDFICLTNLNVAI